MPLHAIRYWAGWSDKDSTETLLKYLLDDKYEYENDFGNFYNPDFNPQKRKFVVDEEKDDINAALKEMKHELISIKKEIKTLKETKAQLQSNQENCNQPPPTKIILS